jgi:molybdopterin-containing oxidoreductase family membrane subunit
MPKGDLMHKYIVFWLRMFRCGLTGSTHYFLWLGLLGVLSLLGLYSYGVQCTQGFTVTNLSDQVSWGAYIANFTFLVGVAAAAVLLVVPSYLYKSKDIKKVVLLGEILAFVAIIMCLLFIAVDLGRPDRFLHILPYFGKLNFPQSILAWDVIVLNGYLFLNVFIPGYLLYMKYLGKEPNAKYYLPFVFISIAWAISVHTVTAFLYSGLGGRPFWNTAILAPRFLVSAFAGGPALLMLIFQTSRRLTKMKIPETVFDYLKRIMTYTMLINLFLLGCEVFKEFYTNSTHVLSAQYLFLGINGHRMLVPYIWSAILMELFAIFVLLTPNLRNNWKFMRVACVMAFVGIWVEKGMGLIVPGFIPTPLGDLVEYTPSKIEILVSLGIWSFGALIFTMIGKVIIAIETGELRFQTRENLR